MRLPVQLGYRALAQLARGAAAVAPPGESKILRALRARRGIRERYRAWGVLGRDRDRPLLWVHAPSVGEGLQARPVLNLMRAREPSTQLAYTHFSPSAIQFAATLDVDFHDFLPFDTPTDAAIALESLLPTALVFSKLDVWPVLTREAHRRGVRLGLISATLARGSSRRSRAASALLRDAYAALDAVGALPHLVIARLASPRPTIVAGSTWPADEAVLLPAFVAVRRSIPQARLIIAPHEPTPEHLAPIEAWARAESLAAARLEEAGAPATDVVIVDRVGVLGELYVLGDVAFVGGGFHDAGLHSVLEPAALGTPVVFGPRHHNSRDAGLLVARAGAVAVSSESELARRINTWFRDSGLRREAGDAARALVRSGVGAAERSFELVDRLLS